MSSEIDSHLMTAVSNAVEAGKLLAESAENLGEFLAGTRCRVAHASVRELVEAGNWNELDNRFFKRLAFGTGGLRGKSIGAMVTGAEWGVGGPMGRPEFPCMGSNAMNFQNVSRATQGLARYVLRWHRESGLPGRPSICLAYDTRHFSREFAEFAAEVLADFGCDAYVFDAPRSTPELSFAVRQMKSAAGINLTASHNPPEYCGYKVYFADGGQIVEPHASGIIAEVNAVASPEYEALSAGERGVVFRIDAAMDLAYLDRLETMMLEPEVIRSQSLKVVYTPLHGVGSAIVLPLLQRLGCDVTVVESQNQPDGRFPTVESPNPENASALKLAMELAEKSGADLVLATDPDADRLGIAARGRDGRLHILTGNQIGSILAEHRLRTFFKLGILDESNRDRAVLITTFVTSNLQKAIAERFGVRWVETLTGFKYLGAKLEKYERALPPDVRNCYRSLSELETRRLRLEQSSLFVFGSEESYGYSGADFVRDKDANAATAMVIEAAAAAMAEGRTLVEQLDEILCDFGYFAEASYSLVMDGADGAQKIRALVASLAADPPRELAGRRVEKITDFSQGGILDTEGDAIPDENLQIYTLEGGVEVAARPSGTEPKMKFYLFFGSANAPGVRLSERELADLKADGEDAMAEVWAALRAEADRRLAG